MELQRFKVDSVPPVLLGLPSNFFPCVQNRLAVNRRQPGPRADKTY